MKYGVVITRSAEKDISGALDYIEYNLHNPTAADALLDEVESRISELADFPEKYALIDDPVLKAWGLRFTVIGNYLAFYVINKEERNIAVVRFLYGKRDWITILRQDFNPDS